jgi:hypothetical protein
MLEILSRIDRVYIWQAMTDHLIRNSVEATDLIGTYIKASTERNLQVRAASFTFKPGRPVAHRDNFPTRVG